MNAAAKGCARALAAVLLLASFAPGKALAGVA